MGRFDALTQLEDKQPLVDKEKTTGETVNELDNSSKKRSPARLPDNKQNSESVTSPEQESPLIPKGGKPASQQASKSLNASQLKQAKFDKYSTYLRPGYKKELKAISNERDCKDYEILDEALTIYFANLKK
jgi:hypothetical protein